MMWTIYIFLLAEKRFQKLDYLVNDGLTTMHLDTYADDLSSIYMQKKDVENVIIREEREEIEPANGTSDATEKEQVHICFISQR